MATSHAARQRHRRVPAGTLAGWLMPASRAVAAVAAGAVVTVLPLLAAPADAAQAGTATARHPATVLAPLQLTVTSMKPAFAENGRTLTVSGLVRNVSKAAASTLSVRLWSSATALGSREDLASYANGSLVPPGQSPLSITPITREQLGAGSTWQWTARIPVSKLGLTCFGVYPLTAEVSDAAGSEIARDPVPLPYWPKKAVNCPAQRRPQPVPVSWIWPLIDTPHQGACHGLLNNDLAATIAPDGRLGELLAIGAKYAATARLTWAIDPALLDNVRTMRRPYQVSDSPDCGGGTRFGASPAAATWLSALGKATSGQPVFVTPYADVDIAALIRDGNPDLNLAFADGNQVAHQVLGRVADPVALAKADGKRLGSVAWPVGGTASPGVLEKLAALKVSTVILTMPDRAQDTVTPGAVSSTLTGIGRTLHILLADRDIDELLATPATSSSRPGASFSVSQLYLAQTAQIAAQAPGRSRPILVAPPRRWDPSRQLATGLLADTVAAPWLSPQTAGQLETLPPQHSALPAAGGGRELSKKLLRGVAKLDRQVALLESIRVAPDPLLYHALFGIESSAWRGRASQHARAMLARTSQHVRSQLAGLTIGVGGKGQKLYVTLGGKVSTVTVLIHNPLSYPVRVAVTDQVSASTTRVTMTGPHTVPIPAHSYSAPVRLTVHTSGTGESTIRLSLTSPAGVPLPTNALTMHVRPTDFGTVALVICAAALAVFVIASAARALRGRPGEAASTLGDASPPGGQGSQEPHNEPDYPDSVSTDGQELTSAGHAIADTDAMTPGRLTEEHR